VIRRHRTKPLAAAVEGPAFGGGFEKELLITGAVLDAEHGCQLGFVSRGTDPGDAPEARPL
jgi:enoyl-CoA hydratase/carnithine racemase